MLARIPNARSPDMTSSARDRLRKIPILGGLLRRLAAVGRLPASLQSLNGRLDEITHRLENVERQFDEASRLLRGDVGPAAGQPLDIAAVRNQLESVPLELSALRRDLAKLEERA
jgi:hypothetical protein